MGVWLKKSQSWVGGNGGVRQGSIVFLRPSTTDAARLFHLSSVLLWLVSMHACMPCQASDNFIPSRPPIEMHAMRAGRLTDGEPDDGVGGEGGGQVPHALRRVVQQDPCTCIYDRYGRCCLCK